MSRLKISVVCCDNTPEKLSQIVEIEVDSALLDELVLADTEQQLAAGEAKGLHNAAHHEQHGPVTYLQEVHEGGFSIFVGAPDSLQETFIGTGGRVAFIDDQGPGHGSKVGPDGVRRTLRVLKGHLELPS
ncbi:MAG: hypothetical protein GY903_29280 [Fuerstiella sp.]|nr:hypothetical protein [Fuerstiella sp.]MCP4858590.1 hypothetical protein [Fuerstiella sp.]